VRRPASLPRVVATGTSVVLALALALPALAAPACSAGGGAEGTRDAARDTPAFVDPRAAICADASTSSVGFDLVQTIFTQNCVTCHSLGNDLNLTSGVAWSDLVNHPAPTTEACGGTLVVPDDPNASYLYQKLTNPNPCSGSQMPRTDVFPNPLPSCVIALISAWIQEGAPGPVSDAGASGG
jgi:hypothetical protein